MSQNPSRIYLASQSPRRQELLQQIGVSFEPLLMRSDPLRSNDVDETPLANEHPVDYVKRVTLAKAQAGRQLIEQRQLPALPLLAADTAVILDDHIFGKPCSAEHAAQMLRTFSGKEHQVMTAVAIADGSHSELELVTTDVKFIRLNETRIQAYLQSNEYIGKAGAYAIQGMASLFVEHINGSYSGVMGLPLFETGRLLRKFNYPLP